MTQQFQKQDILPQEDKQNIEKKDMEKLFLPYFFHSQQITHPKLNISSTLTSQKHLPNTEHHLLVFYVHRIQLYILAGKSGFPTPWIGPPGHL